MGSEEGDSSFEEEENKEQLKTGVGKRRRNVGYDFYFLSLCFKMRHIIPCFHFDKNYPIDREKWDNNRKEFLEK